MMSRLLGIREFTGYHMIGVLFLFFGTIISVNLTLAYFAASSWTGLVVKNSYVESQHFNEHTAERLKMAELGWSGNLLYDGEAVEFRLNDGEGRGLLADVVVKLGRPAFERDDRTLTMETSEPGLYRASTELGQGIWNADVDVQAVDGTRWKHSYRFNVKD